MTTATLTPEALNVPQPAASATERRPFFEFARLFAAVSIVWLHTMRSPEMLDSTVLGRFAVPFFTAAAVFMICESAARCRRKTLAEYTRNRFMRLYVPFLAWTVIYLAFKLFKGKLAPGQPNDFPGMEVLLSGGFYHLWFLPFVFFVSVITFAVVRNRMGNAIAETRMALLSAMAGGLLAVVPPPSQWIAAGTWAEYWWTALPAAFWGISIAVLVRHAGRSYQQSQLAPIAGLAIFAIATAWTWHVGRSLLAENLAGIGFLVFALAPWQGPAVRKVATLGTLAYGIYLSHLLIIKTCEAIAAKFAVSVCVELDLTIFVVSMFGSVLLTWLLSKARITRWLVA
jgi:surface polysaccharide O-acyltransferase-like enzyme